MRILGFGNLQSGYLSNTIPPLWCTSFSVTLTNDITKHINRVGCKRVGFNVI